jgi:DsbC/DsbD-like thiol-disulfide interchange protein
MRLLTLPIAAACVLCAGLRTTATEVAQARHARVELIAQQSSIASNLQLWLGVHFQLEKGWHIYWVNPGDSGQPPVFQWQLPPGFSAGAIQWPRPDKMQTTHLADYGYHDDVLLLVPLQASKDLKGNSRVEIGLDAKWLICREVCIADHAHLNLALPVSASPKDDANTAQLFASTLKLVPKPLPPGWRVSVRSGKDSFALTIATGTPVRQAQFFPLEPDQIENAAPQTLRTISQGAQITLKKSDQLLKPIARLRGVLVLAKDKAYAVSAAVIEQKK